MRFWASGKKVFCSLALLVLTGCAATEPSVTAKAEMGDVKLARGSVAVVADVSMADAAEASELVLQVSQALKTEGFPVKSSPDDADLVIIPSLAYSSAAVDEAEGPAYSREGFQPATMGNQSGMTYNTFSLSSLDEYRAPSRPSVPQKCGLRVTAVTRKDWFDTEKSRNVERVWRVIAITSTDSRSQDEIVASLVQAASVKFRAILAIARGNAPTSR
ncbi:MAG: hypothetical protein BGO12_07330 [Verrucomicrobia bacterium 61-8]|nr:hypothetical protein [Verrucomicrobiota bacterium]OJV03871.1 MAG: hypothetical protein BGO12_07330 [Verrucomicrobia bacterium 61-8]